jgi:hypothetical protein
MASSIVMTPNLWFDVQAEAMRYWVTIIATGSSTVTTLICIN